jgi:hypothetical protein
LKNPLIYDKIYRNKNENKRMENWHKYWRSENPLIAERSFVYMGAPNRAPGAVESKDAIGKNPDDKEQPATLDDVKAKLDTAKGNLKKIREKHGKKIENHPKYKAAKQKIAEIENKIQEAEKQKGEKRQEVINQTNTEVDDLLFKMTGKRPSRVKVIPPGSRTPKVKPTTKPKGSPEGSKEKVPTNPKEKLSYLLGKVLDGGYDSFQKNKGEITNLLKSLNIKPGRQNQSAGYDLPGGFTVGHVNWSKGEGMPNFAIFKGGQTLCYMQDMGQGKMELSFARELGQNERPGYNRRMVELMKANVLLPKALSQIKAHPKTKRLTFANPSALNDFKSALLIMAKMSRLDKKAGPDWEAVYGGKNIQFERSGESLNGAFKIRVGNNIMHFDTASPNRIGVEEPGWKGNGEKGISYRSDGDFLFTPKEQKQNDKMDSMLKPKAKEKPTKAKKTVDKKALGRDVERALGKLPDKSLKIKVGKLVNSKFKKLILQSKSNQKALTVKAKKNDKKGLSLIKKTPIHELLKLDTIKNEVVMLTITGASGKSPRKAMYYPGQKTAYVLDDKGKQTPNRVKFHNGDTISLDFKDPEAKDYANLNRDKNKAQVFSAERIEGREVFSEYDESVTKFGKLKGKLSDLNLNSLAKYKSASYNPKKILTGENWSKDKVKKLGYKKATEILKAEIKVIEEGGSKLAKKKGIKDPFGNGLF